MTWFQLWKRFGKQPLHLTKSKDVPIKLPDGEHECMFVYTSSGDVTIKLPDGEHECMIVYTSSGSDWHLEIEPIKEDI
jgi:hypothetical protein